MLIQVDNLTGRNDELRSELRETRHELNKGRLQYEKALEQVWLHVFNNIIEITGILFKIFQFHMSMYLVLN